MSSVVRAVGQMKTHYDVLNLSKDCTSKEIKDAFIKLSKKYHPDKNQSSDAHAKFVQVNEAYSVLGREDSRRIYDKNLLYGINKSNHDTWSREEGFSNVRSNRTHYDYTYSQNRYKNYTNSEVASKSRWGAIVFCCILVAIGTGVQLSSSLKRERDYNSQLAAVMLAHARRRDENFSNQQRLQEILDGTYRGLSLQEAKAELDRRKKSSRQ